VLRVARGVPHAILLGGQVVCLGEEVGVLYPVVVWLSQAHVAGWNSEGQALAIYSAQTS
jgi:hypothetical protein